MYVISVCVPLLHSRRHSLRLLTTASEPSGQYKGQRFPPECDKNCLYFLAIPREWAIPRQNSSGPYLCGYVARLAVGQVTPFILRTRTTSHEQERVSARNFGQTPVFPRIADRRFDYK